MARFEELDWCETSMGALVLQRYRLLGGDQEEIYSIQLDGEALMSSAVHESEVALTRLALGRLPSDGPGRDVLVGGLGLGHTAAAALDDPTVRSVEVVEVLPAVLDWHRRGLVPLGERLTTDPRCRLVEADFFGLFSRDGEDYDAILVDIDHSPDQLLRSEHAGFYLPEGLAGVRARLRRLGVFALWSADPVPDDFLDALRSVFDEVTTHEVSFFNLLADCDDTNTIVVAVDSGVD